MRTHDTVVVVYSAHNTNLPAHMHGPYFALRLNMKTTTNEVTRLPVRLERLPAKYRGSFPAIGWTVMQFKSSEDAAIFFTRYGAVAMPCWKRMSVVGGKLVMS